MGELVERLQFITKKIRTLEAERLELLSELDSSGAPEEYGYDSLVRFLEDTLRTGLAESRKLARRTHALYGSTGLSGAPIPPDLPNTAKAYSQGLISTEHVDRIRGFAEEFSAEILLGESWPVAERCLADIATRVGPRGLTRPINALRVRLDPDGKPPNEAELATPARSLRVTEHANHWEFSGRVEPETGRQLQALLELLGTPHDRSDSRDTGQRNGDAFAEILRLAANAKELPEAGGEPFTIMLTMSERSLRKNLGHATGTDGSSIPVEEVRRIACDAGVIPAVLGSHGEVLDMGSRERSAPAKVRRRLIARDQGCAHPDCDRPPSLCHAHHIRHYADGGTTTPDNLVLLCGHHHRLVHHSGWRVRINQYGKPEFTPPEHTRPLRTRSPIAPRTPMAA